MAKKSKAETATFWVGLFALLSAVVTLTDNHFDKIIGLFGAGAEAPVVAEATAGERHTPEMLEKHTPAMLEQHAAPPEQHVLKAAPPDKAATWPWIVLGTAVTINITWFVIRNRRRRHETTSMSEVA